MYENPDPTPPTTRVCVRMPPFYNLFVSHYEPIASVSWFVIIAVARHTLTEAHGMKEEDCFAVSRSPSHRDPGKWVLRISPDRRNASLSLHPVKGACTAVFSMGAWP